MQYLKELSNGDRIKVTKAQYDLDVYTNSDAMVYLVRTDTVTIYHTNGRGYKTPFMPKHEYGGRGRAAARGNLLWNGA